MSKRNNNFSRNPPLFENKKQKKHIKHPSKKKEYINYPNSKQVESRIQYINFKQEAQFNVNRLDLIFQQQPKQIQDKLMKLLLSYNASLQYNKATDLFEVDLLLPFLSEQEKKEFIRQFLQIRRSKHRQNSEQKRKESPPSEQRIELKQARKQHPNHNSNNYNYSQPKQIRKFSFNSNMKFSNQFQEYGQLKEQEMMDELNYQEQRIEEQKQKIVFTNHQMPQSQINYAQKALHSLQSNELNLRKIEQTINYRLKNAISIINRKKNIQQKNKQNENNKSILINDEEPRKQQSIIERLQQSNQFLESQRLFEQRNSLYIKEDIGEQTQQPSEERLFGRNNYEQFNFHTNYHSEKFGQVIEEQQQEEEYEPLFIKNAKKVNNNEKAISFEDYTKQYSTIRHEKNAKSKNNKNLKPAEKNKQENKVNIPRNYFSSKEKDQHKKSQKSFEVVKANDKSSGEKPIFKGVSNKQRVRSRKSSQHSRSVSASGHKESPSKQSQEIKKHLNDFFDNHRQNLQNLYSQIRSKIKTQSRSTVTPPQKAKQVEVQRQKMTQKSIQDFYILVLDDIQQQQSQNTSTDIIPNSKQFKFEMMKQYKKQILINSKNLSSQDLTRYFRYLHTNARKLYIKYLMTKQK